MSNEENKLAETDTRRAMLDLVGILARTVLWVLVTIMALVFAININLVTGLCFLTACACVWYYLLFKA